ncbi:MAG: glycosyltransferase family 4 protein [Tepidisphaeraceae bacterium]
MRIGHYMNGLRHAGGVASYIRRISAAQRQAGHEVALFDRAPRGGAVTHRFGDDVQTRSDAHLIQRVSDMELDILHLHTVVDPDLTTAVPMLRTVHGHWSYCPSGSQFLGRSSKACPRCYGIVGCTWGHFIDRCGSVRPTKFLDDFSRARLERRHHAKVRAVAISDFVRDRMIRSGLDGSLIDVLLSPAPTPSPATSVPHDDPPRFVFLGRLVPEKGAEWLLRAFAQVRTQATLDVCGIGPQQQQLEELSRRLGLGSRVCFHGWVDEPRAFALIEAARAVVFPSLWHEPAGLVTLEAAAHGRAVIASRVGGIPQYAQMLGNAVLVEPNDVAGLAVEIQRLADDPALAETLGQVGREAAARDFDLKRHLEGLDRCSQRAGATCR